MLGLTANSSIFDHHYKPLDVSKIEKLIEYAQKLYDSILDENKFIASCSIDGVGKIIFWDIQTPAGKMKILRDK